ncbi:MAG: DMT family transporter [Salinivirgaceae bacterium]|jgi:drug/metabolite transporter (DMT)-like permease|nr:DMT family transporter [Salinivirgaceae bacterium]
MTKKPYFKAQVAAFLTAVFWGYSFTWTHEVLNYFNPMSIIFMRLVIALCILVPLMFIFKMREKLRPRQLLQLAILGLFQPFLYFIFETYGVKLTTSTVSSVVISMIPLFVPIGAYWFFKEHLTITNIGGIILSFIGVAIIIFDNQVKLSGGWLGLAVLFMAVITAVVYMVLLRKLSASYNVFTINVYQNIFGLLYFLPFFLFDGVPTLMQIEFKSDWIFPLVSLAIFGSAAAFMLFTYAIGKIGASKAAAYNNLVPVITAIAAYWKFSEAISMQKITGIVIVIAGLFLAQKKAAAIAQK